MVTEQHVATARSALFVPGDRPDRFVKAARSGADLVVVDLEDGVPLSAKRQARTEAVRYLQSAPAVVRINSGRHLGDDLSALQGARGLQAIVVPMAEDPAVLVDVASHLDVPVIALVETARGLLAVHDIAAAVGVVRLGLGHLDLAAELGCREDRMAMLYARSLLVVASRAARIAPPLDGVTTTLDDATCADDARYAAGLGFRGKFVVHPVQVAGVHRGMAPTAAEVAWARSMLDSGVSGGARRVGDAMVDAPVLARARQVLDRQAEPEGER